MKQVIIYGGSFNPLHKGHEAIIEHCLQFTQFDEIWIMPSARRDDKPDLLDEQTRLDMLKAYVAESDFKKTKVVVSDFEIALGAPTETIRTLLALRKAYPNTEFTFVFGTDSVADIPNWRGGVYLANQLSIIAVERAGSAVACNPLQHLCAYIAEDVSGLSSTIVREHINRGKSIADQVPKPIAQFIAANGLYCD